MVMPVFPVLKTLVPGHFPRADFVLKLSNDAFEVINLRSLFLELGILHPIVQLQFLVLLSKLLGVMLVVDLAHRLWLQGLGIKVLGRGPSRGYRQ